MIKNADGSPFDDEHGHWIGSSCSTVQLPAAGNTLHSTIYAGQQPHLQAALWVQGKVHGTRQHLQPDIMLCSSAQLAQQTQTLC
jgi:hypothetical protein